MEAVLKDRGYALVLSGGAALGCAHLGVFDVLEERGLRPAEITGTSMGAIIAAAIAMGLSAREIADHCSRFSSLTSWMRPAFKRPGLLDTRILREIFTSVFGSQTMEGLSMPLQIVATDFISGKARVFAAGDSIPLIDAVLASMSIPVLFPPVALEGSMYVDGFVSANLPVDYVADSALPVLAVDVMSAKALRPLPATGTSLLPRPLTVIDSYERTLRLMIQAQTRLSLRSRKNVFLLEPLLCEYKSYHFDRWQQIRRAGYVAAEDFFRLQDAVEEQL